ncbi:ABC transporter permease [[Mycoplasma] cavipharyngis]|uniref:ABC transporter permease subunit n=1 Tax=[Mycoplasma] cavipharyngis TaxID=92757 RepID=UPI003703A419
MIKHNWFFDWYYDQNHTLKKQIRPWVKFTLVVLVISGLIVLFWSQNVGFYSQSFSLFTSYLKLLFNPINVNSSYPSYNLTLLSINFLFITLGNIFLGTIAGWITALITAYLSSYHFLKQRWLLIINWIIIILRAFPVFVFIGLWKTGFNNYSVAIMIYYWFTWLWLHKYFINLFRGLDNKQYHFHHRIGYNQFMLFYQFVWPQIQDKSFLFLIFSIESNLRWTSILGSLGISGIGSLIYEPIVKAEKNFQEVLIPFVFLFITLLFFEILLSFYNSLTKKIKRIKSLNPKVNAKKIYHFDQLKLVLFFFFTIIIIYSLTQINFTSPDNANMINYIAQVFDIRWNLFGISSLDDNPFYLFFLVILQAVTIFIWTIVFGIIFGILSSHKVINKYCAYSFAVFNLLMRSFPIVLLFYLFNPIFNTPQSTAVVLIIFHNSFSLAKKINAVLYRISRTQINYYRMLKYSYFWIVWHYLWPNIKKEIINLSGFEFEIAVRDVVIMGAFGASLFGQKFVALEVRNPSSFAVYLWTFWAGILFLEFSSYLQRKLLIKNIQKKYFWSKIWTNLYWQFKNKIRLNKQ